MPDLISRSREEILREAEEKAYANEKSFHGCSQSTWPPCRTFLIADFRRIRCLQLL
jgi:hypothetical protein